MNTNKLCMIKTSNFTDLWDTDLNICLQVF